MDEILHTISEYGDKIEEISYIDVINSEFSHKYGKYLREISDGLVKSLFSIDYLIQKYNAQK